MTMSAAKKLRTLHRMLAWCVRETERPDRPVGTSAARVNRLWCERKALEWALAQLDPSSARPPAQGTSDVDSPS